MIKVDKSLDDYLRNIHQDYLINFLSVHDEVVQKVDKHLAQPIMVEIAKKSMLPDIFDKTSIPYIQFTFDFEYDKHGSYTASSSFDIYKYTILQQLGMEKVSGKTMYVNNTPIDAKQKNSTPKVLEVSMDEIDVEILQQIPKLKKGDTTLIVFINDEKFINVNKYDYDSLKSLFSKYL